MLTSGRAQIHNEAGGDRIARAKRHHRRNTGRLGCDRRRIAKDRDDIDLALQFLHQLRKLDGLPGRRSRSFEGEILSKRIAALCQSIEEKLCERSGAEAAVRRD